MAIRTTPGEDAAVAKSVRELLDDARALEHTAPDAARSLAQQARVLARSQHDGAGEAEALYRLAANAYSSGDADDAFAIALDARELAARSSATLVESWALNLLSLVHHDAGNLSDALEAALASLELYREFGGGPDEGNLLNTVAIIHHSLGDADRALVTYEAALTANRGLEVHESDVLILVNLAEIRLGRGEYLLAASLTEQALELARRGATEYEAVVLTRLAAACCGLSDFDRADALLDDAEPMLLSTSGSAQPSAMFALYVGRARVALSRGDADGAIARYEEGLAIAREYGLFDSELAAHTELAAINKGLGRFERALHHQEQRFAKYEEIFTRGTDLRIKTLQIAHDTETARQQAEILRLRTGELEALVRGRTDALESYQVEAFERLAVLAEFRDTDTGEHTVRVGDLAGAMANELGQPLEDVDRLRMAARLHDIGKVAVPDSILLKPGPLTAEEFEIMKTHTTVGAEILAGSSSPLIQLAAEVALHHHERWDGTGYPAGLAGDAIPLSGRIVCIADVFDALCSARTYKHAWTRLEAATYIVDGRGEQFDPSLVEVFLRVAVRQHPELRSLLPGQ